MTYRFGFIIGFLVVVGLVIFASNLRQKAPITSVKADVLVSTDVYPPTSQFNVYQTGHFGQKITGKAYDLGGGVAQVTIQLERVSDKAVWDGHVWQESPGETQTTQLLGSDFTYTIPTQLIREQHYIIRSQAIDHSGNAQAVWAQLNLVGGDVGLVESR